MHESPVSTAKRKLLEYLKLRGACTSGQLASEFELTAVAVRQHMLAMEQIGLVRQETRPPAGRGRPSVLWSLSEGAAELFPDRHAELTVGLIAATRRALGEDGLLKVIQARAAGQVREYREAQVATTGSLKSRVEALAARRTAEGYMAEVTQEKPGVYLLTEHHCPICDAARSCAGLCSAELDVFRRVLGRDVSVERVSHLLSGDARCVYRVRRK